MSKKSKIRSHKVGEISAISARLARASAEYLAFEREVGAEFLTLQASLLVAIREADRRGVASVFEAFKQFVLRNNDAVEVLNEANSLINKDNDQ